MKKLFISQPMKDKTDEQILQEREKAIAAAKQKVGDDVEVIVVPWKIIRAFSISRCSLFCTRVGQVPRMQNRT